MSTGKQSKAEIELEFLVAPSFTPIEKLKKIGDLVAEEFSDSVVSSDINNRVMDINSELVDVEFGRSKKIKCLDNRNEKMYISVVMIYTVSVMIFKMFGISAGMISALIGINTAWIFVQGNYYYRNLTIGTGNGKKIEIGGNYPELYRMTVDIWKLLMEKKLEKSSDEWNITIHLLENTICLLNSITQISEEERNDFTDMRTQILSQVGNKRIEEEEENFELI